MYTTTDGTMKNALGGLLSRYRHNTHTWIHKILVDLLAIQKEIQPEILPSWMAKLKIGGNTQHESICSNSIKK